MTSLLTRGRAAAIAAALATAGALLAIAPANAAGTPPTSPQHVTARQTAARTVTVNWDAPANPGSSAVSDYLVGYSAGEWGNGEQVGPGARTDTFTGIDPGSYIFSVTAENASGTSARVEVPVTVVGSAPVLYVSNPVLTAGKTLVLTGSWKAGRTLTLERAFPGRSYAKIGTITTSSTGAYHRSLTVLRTASYRTRPSTGNVSTARKVTVRNRVTLAATRVASRTYTLAGTVYPAVTGQAVHLYAARSGGAYSALATVHTTSTGHFSFKHTYPAAATYTFKAVSAATPRNAAGTVVRKVAVS